MTSPRSPRGVLTAKGGEAREPLLEASGSFHGDVEMQASLISGKGGDSADDGSAGGSAPASVQLRNSVRFSVDEVGDASPTSGAPASFEPASPTERALAEERARMGKWAKLSSAVNRKYRIDPSAQGVDVVGLDSDNPFNQELGHGEFCQNYLPNAFQKSCRTMNIDETSISVVLHREINPWFHLVYQIFTCGLFDVLFLRRYYRLFTVENRMAMTNMGRILLWSREAKGQRLSFVQTIVMSVTSPFVVNACFSMFFITLSGTSMRAFAGNWNSTVVDDVLPFFRVMDDSATFGVLGLFAMMVYVLVYAVYKFMRARLGLSLYTNMQAFVASDLCATSLLLSESHFCGRRRTKSQSRLFFGRYPTLSDLAAGWEFPDIGLVNTQPIMTQAAPAAAETSRGTQGTSEEETAGSSTLFIVGTLSNLLLVYSVLQWIVSEIMIAAWIPFINLDSPFWAWVAQLLQITVQVHDGKSTPYSDQLANVAAVAVIFLSIKTVSEAALRAYNRTRPNATTSSQKESSLFTNTTDEDFDRNIEHMRYFISSLSAHAVKFGDGFRPPPPEVFLKHAKGKKNFGRASTADSQGSRGLYSFGDSVASIRSSEVFAGDDYDTIRQKFEPYIRLLPADDPIHHENSFIDGIHDHKHEHKHHMMVETILAVYPMARSSLLKYKLLSILTCGIYPLLIHCRLIRRTHGAVILTNARLIQISLSCTWWGWAMKMDSFILDNSLKSCTIEAPCPSPCTWNMGYSEVLISSRLGPLGIRLPGAKWFGMALRRMWQALSMVKTGELTLRKGLGLPGDDEKPNAVASWLHLAIVVITRLELRVREVELDPRVLPKAVPGKFYDWEVISNISGAARQREKAQERRRSMERDETGSAIGERMPPGGYFVTMRKAPTAGWSFAFSDGSSDHIITDLGSLGGSNSDSSTSMKVVSWLSLPEMYTRAIKLETNQSALLVAALWIPGPADAEGTEVTHNVSDGTRGAAASSRRSTMDSNGEAVWNDAKGWEAGSKAGWKPFGREWHPPKVAGEYGRCVCYSLKVKKAKDITIPERPEGIAFTLFGGQLLWDIIPGIQNEDADGKIHTCEFPREHTEEVQWETALLHERPDFFRMKIDIPLVRQKWTITNHRVINFKIEPLTGLWTKVRNINRCFASPPRETLTFIPLENIKGFQTEESYTMRNSCIGRCVRTCCGRNTDNRSFTSMKLLTRVGRDRQFTEGGSVTRLSYLDPKAPVKNQKERITDASFYMESLMELRVWASAADLANLASDAQASGALAKIGGRAHTAVVPSAEQEGELPLDLREIEPSHGRPKTSPGLRGGSIQAAKHAQKHACKMETLWIWLLNPSNSTVFRGWQPRHASGKKSQASFRSFSTEVDKLMIGHPFQKWKEWWWQQHVKKHNWSRIIHKILRTMHAQQCAGLVTYGHALRLLAGKMSLKLDPKMLETVHSSFEHLSQHTLQKQAQRELDLEEEEEEEEEDESLLRNHR